MSPATRALRRQEAREERWRGVLALLGVAATAACVFWLVPL